MTLNVGLVTGASRGLGRAIALALAARGFAVAVTARSKDGLETLAAQIREGGGQALAVAGDVARPADVAAVVDQVQERFGQIDVLINNAAVNSPLGLTAAVDPAAWLRGLHVNLGGPFLFVRAVLPGMMARRRGVVVNVSSGAATGTTPGMGAYSVSKAGLNQLTRIVAAEAGPSGVRAHAVYPYLVATDMQAEMRAAPDGVVPDAVRQRFRGYYESGLLRPPEEAAQAIAWLADESGAEWTDWLMNLGDDATRSRLGLPAKGA